MKYISTRNANRRYSFEDVLFSGYASDGGLFMPTELPQLKLETLNKWQKLSYISLLKEIARIFIDENEISSHDLNEVVDKSFHDFQPPNIIPIAQLGNGLNVAELFHGNTLAFKDLALNLVGQLMDYFLLKRKKRVIVLVGTSGDTGSSAIHSLRTLQMVDMIVLYPRNGCTRLQELQMITALDENVHCFAVEGLSDDLDVPIKNCFLDENFVTQYDLCSVNSINWARILAQIAHFFYVYFQMNETMNYVMEFIIPTGAAGNVTAGCIAKLMGLPIDFAVCTNQNRVVQQFLTEGVYTLPHKVMNTLACAMDIQMAYNVERLLHLITDGDFETILQFYTNLEHQKTAKLTPELKFKLQKLIGKAHFYNDDVIKTTIKKCWDENRYRICPHTATAVAFHYEQPIKNNLKRVCIATASPDKFPEVMTTLKIEMENNPKLCDLETAPTKFSTMKQGEDWDAILRAKIKEIYDSRINSKMAIN